jgi:DNA-binding NarL/FixJ family response regulator
MIEPPTRCVLLANPHHGLSESIGRLLATAFGAVVTVADEVSLFESASRLQSELAVVDLALSRGDALDLVRRFHSRFPNTKVIIVSIHEDASVSRSVMEAGADGFVIKRAISTDLLAAADSVLAGACYVSPAISERALRRGHPGSETH